LEGEQVLEEAEEYNDDEEEAEEEVEEDEVEKIMGGRKEGRGGIRGRFAVVLDGLTLSLHYIVTAAVRYSPSCLCIVVTWSPTKAQPQNSCNSCLRESVTEAPCWRCETFFKERGLRTFPQR